MDSSIWCRCLLRFSRNLRFLLRCCSFIRGIGLPVLVHGFLRLFAELFLMIVVIILDLSHGLGRNSFLQLRPILAMVLNRIVKRLFLRRRPLLRWLLCNRRFYFVNIVGFFLPPICFLELPMDSWALLGSLAYFLHLGSSENKVHLFLCVFSGMSRSCFSPLTPTKISFFKGCKD